jgi:plasmid stabilization system protein ParE
MRILWSPTAVADLVSIREYISKDSPAAARKEAAKIREAANRLVEFPIETICDIGLGSQ